MLPVVCPIRLSVPGSFRLAVLSGAAMSNNFQGKVLRLPATQAADKNFGFAVTAASQRSWRQCLMFALRCKHFLPIFGVCFLLSFSRLLVRGRCTFRAGRIWSETENFSPPTPTTTAAAQRKKCETFTARSCRCAVSSTRIARVPFLRCIRPCRAGQVVRGWIRAMKLIRLEDGEL